MENKKEEKDDVGDLTADEIVKLRTGFNEVEDSKTLGYLKERQRRWSPSKGNPEKWSVLRELSKKRKGGKNAEENSKLDRKIADIKWTEALRGGNFLRKNEGTGGGHVPIDESKLVSDKLRKKSKNN